MNTPLAGANGARLLQSAHTDFPDKLTVRDAGIANLPTITMTLTGRPVSEAASLAIAALASEIARPRGRPRRPSREYIETLGALIADLLNAASYNPLRSCFRRLATGAFSGGEIGYRPCRRVLDDLARHHLVVTYAGTAAFGGEPGYVTRIFPTAAFVERMASFGITPAERLSHFDHAKAGPVAAPIRLKAGSRRGPTWNKIPGKLLPINMNDPKVAALSSTIMEINAFMAEQTFSMADYVAFFRGFNCGDIPGYGWNKGGRLNCVEGGYQMMSKEARKNILINGLKIVELDISSCHLTIAYGLLDLSLPSGNELYKAGNLPREVVKLFVNYLLGGGKVPSRWTADHGAMYNENDPKALSKNFPIRFITPRIMEAHPILQQAIDRGITWADLQHIESNIIVKAVHDLAINHRICALPVHDSLRVARPYKELGEACLSKAFYSQTGLIPLIK